MIASRSLDATLSARCSPSKQRKERLRDGDMLQKDGQEALDKWREEFFRKDGK